MSSLTKGGKVFLLWPLVLAAWFYSPILKAGFVYDDQWYIVQNPALRTWDIRSFFTQASTVAAPGSGLGGDVYRPLGTLALAAAYHAWGLHPLPYHLLCLGLHFLNALLLFELLAAILKDNHAAFAGMVVFLWHPVQVQSVAWAAQLSGLIGMTGFLISLRRFVATGHSRLSVWAGWTAFALAVFSKETAIVLPLVMGVLWKEGSAERRRFAIGVAGIAIFYLACRQTVLGHMSQFSSGGGAWIESLALGLLAFPVYLRKIICPIALRVSYAYPLILDPLKVGAAAILLLAYIALANRLRQRDITASQALGWILAALLPFLGIVPIRSFVAERFLYIPMAGAALLAGWLWQRHVIWRPWLALWAIFLAVQTARAVPAWQDEKSLWENAAHMEPTNAFAHACYAQTLGDTPAAEEEYLRTLVNSPSEGLRYAAYKNLAYLHHLRKDKWKANYWRAKSEKVKPAD